MYGEMKIHLETKEVFLGARKVELSPYEFRLLSYLARHPGKVYSKNQIFEAVYEEDEGKYHTQYYLLPYPQPA